MKRRSFIKSLVAFCVLPAVPVPRAQVLELRITSVPVVAQARKLKAVWTVEWDQHLTALYNIRAEKQLIEAVNRQWVRVNE